MTNNENEVTREEKIEAAKKELTAAIEASEAPRGAIAENCYIDGGRFIASIHYPKLGKMPDDTGFRDALDKVEAAFEKLCQIVADTDELRGKPDHSGQAGPPYFELDVDNLETLQEISRHAAEAIGQKFPTIPTPELRQEFNNILLDKGWVDTKRSDGKNVKRLWIGNPIYNGPEAIRCAEIIQHFGSIETRTITKGDDLYVEVLPGEFNLIGFNVLCNQARETAPIDDGWGSRITPPSPSPDLRERR